MLGRFLLALAALSLAACDGDDNDQTTGWPPPRQPTGQVTNPASWEIGPPIRQKAGLPKSPSRSPEGLWQFDFPHPTQQVGTIHYLTFVHGPLVGKTGLSIRFRIDAQPDVAIRPRDYPTKTGTLTLYFQRHGDPWTANDQYETYRWYCSKRLQLIAGEQTVSCPFDEPIWKAILRSNSTTAPEAFRDAIANAQRVGFVLGGGDGAGHGVYATGPARFTLLDYRIE